MAEAGDENLYAAARDIAKALGKDPSAAGDILQILSGYGASGNRSSNARASASHGCANLNLDRSLNSLERQISSYVVEDRPIWSDPVDSRNFLDAVDELIAMAGDLRSMPGDKSVGICLSRADELIHQVMFRLQEEFGYVMDRATDSFDSDDEFSGEEDNDSSYDVQSHQVIVARPVTDYKIVIEPLQSSVIGDLNAIAVRMVAGGFGKECSRVYSSRRREFLEESLSRLHLRGLSMEEVQESPWQDLEEEIDRWIKAVTMVFRVFFPSERLLCDRVFSDLPVTDLSFMEVCRGTTTQLLNFADAIALGSRLPERLFKVMDLYESVQDLIPRTETLFSNKYCSPLKHEAFAIHKRLGEAIRGIFMELENLIRRDPPKTAFPGGGIHPITRYVMNYLRAACKSRQTLEQILDHTGVPGSETRPLSVQIIWVLELLESNLEGKKRTYRDPPLCFLFMMNNGKYILDKATDNELGSILGDDWIVKHAAKLRQYHSNFLGARGTKSWD